ncbi:hypothetical protein SFC07_10720 [Corynebacterium callunae]|uniref:6PGD fold domain-containing protein n=1 Tax=Corynebacterium callunae TaxID=1721 RepID=UPI0039825F02
MRAPRLNIGTIADGQDRVRMGELLATAGHHVAPVSEFSEISNFELVIISVSDDHLEGVVEKLSLFARSGQMFLHTSLAHSIQIMDPLETAGGIVMAAYPLGEDRWVASALDELGETIVGLLVGELGGSIIDVPEPKRMQLAAALTYVGFINTVRNDAINYLSEFLDDYDTADDLVTSTFGGLQRLPDLNTLSRQYDSIDNLGRRRLFRDLARRQAEISRAQDIELWAIQKEDQ